MDMPEDIKCIIMQFYSSMELRRRKRCILQDVAVCNTARATTDELKLSFSEKKSTSGGLWPHTFQYIISSDISRPGAPKRSKVPI
jgi:hypothetical protein